MSSELEGGGTLPSPQVDFMFDIAGVDVKFTVSADDVPTILGWSTSEVILYLGSEGPQFQEGLRQAFGS